MSLGTSDVALLRGLDVALEESLRALRSQDGPVGLLFSGGVDSALLAWELRGLPRIRLWTMGRENSSDLRMGREAAHLLGLPWSGIVVGPAEVRSAVIRHRDALEGLPNVSRIVLLSIALAMKGASERFLVCGQGADELFLGYAHYRGLTPADAERRSQEDWGRLLEHDWPRTQAIAASLGKEVVAPYLTPAFERAARGIPVESRVPADQPKRVFRAWAVARGLPPALALRPKKAMQYGSGVDGLARKLRRSPEP